MPRLTLFETLSHGQISNFTRAEPNANEKKKTALVHIWISFGSYEVRV